MRTIVCAVSVALLLSTGARAQEFQPVKPGPEHAKMKQLEGTWDAKVESEGKESKGTMIYKMGLGGLWMFEQFQGEFGGMKFEGRGASTYDPQKKKYINIWIDSMSTTPMLSEGNFEKNGRMVMKGQMPQPDGKMVQSTMTTEMKGDNDMVFTMSVPGPDGKAMTMMKITYKRQK